MAEQQCQELGNQLRQISEKLKEVDSARLQWRSKYQELSVQAKKIEAERNVLANNVKDLSAQLEKGQEREDAVSSFFHFFLFS